MARSSIGPDGAAQRYELLRGQIIGKAMVRCDGLELEVLIRHGLIRWMHTLAAYTASPRHEHVFAAHQQHDSQHRSRPTDSMPSSTHRAIAATIANMALAQLSTSEFAVRGHSGVNHVSNAS